MLKTFTIALFAIFMSVGFAQAHQHFIPRCSIGQPAATTCACGTTASHHRLLCVRGQWCHPSYGCTL